MINFTERLDKAVRIAAWAHEQAGEHRKGSDIPYIIHPFGVMLIASNVTDNEDTLIACLLHDVIEDVPADIYSESDMRLDFGDKVTRIVLDVSKDESNPDWHERSQAYLDHLQHKATDEAIIVATSDKIHNLQAVLTDHKQVGDNIWQRFTTKSADDQLWWYQSVLKIAKDRQAPKLLVDHLAKLIAELLGVLET